MIWKTEHNLSSNANKDGNKNNDDSLSDIDKTSNHIQTVQEETTNDMMVDTAINEIDDAGGFPYNPNHGNGGILPQLEIKKISFNHVIMI